MTRRDALKTTLLFSSGVLGGMNPLAVDAADELRRTTGRGGLHVLALGDFGTNNAKQRQVADAMVGLAGKLGVSPTAVLALGDNFYGHLSPETIPSRFGGYYPKETLDCPFYAVLGNQ